MVRPHVPAISTPPRPWFVFLALAYLVLGTGMAGNVVRDRASEPFLPDQAVGLSWLGLALVCVVLAWRGSGVQLRPDGLRQRGALGSLVVPWDAVPTVPAVPPAPQAVAVRLTYGRPELVRRHGLFLAPRRLRTEAIDPRIIAGAVRYYLEHPGRRAAIGTEGEHDRLMRALLDSPPGN